MSKRKVSDLELAAAGFRSRRATTQQGQRGLVPDIVAALSALDQEQRAAVFEKLREHYCIHCGAEEKEGERLCQCTNDE
jgi:hypothetical protein